MTSEGKAAKDRFIYQKSESLQIRVSDAVCRVETGIGLIDFPLRTKTELEELNGIECATRTSSPFCKINLGVLQQ